ncbi:MAG: response regulator, partial [Candidatus Promineifilaceae bacterium]
MTKPYILSVDDEPQVLNAVVRDLRRQYQRDYRILKAGSGQEALDSLQQLRERNEAVALLLADHRMPVMTGTEFLAKAIKLFPEARRVLLTAYADTEAAITSINEIGLDYYLMKPWDPPEQNLYPILDDLLLEWSSTVTMPYQGIRVAGTLWSPHSHDVKDFLSRNRVPYRWLDIEVNAEAKELVESVIQGGRDLPVVFLPDGGRLIGPSIAELAHSLGMQTEASAPYYDLIIIGGGPAGLGAA